MSNPGVGKMPLAYPGYTEKEIKLYPLLSDPPYCLAGAGAYVFGSWAELVPANIITSDFLALGLMVRLNDMGTLRHWVLQLGKGLSGAETSIAAVSGFFWYDSVAGRHWLGRMIPLPIPIKIAANSRVAMRAADSNGTELLYEVRLQYVEFPI